MFHLKVFQSSGTPGEEPGKWSMKNALLLSYRCQYLEKNVDMKKYRPVNKYHKKINHIQS